MKPKINFFSLLAALVFFMLPWIEIQCSQQPVMSQSGMEMIYGGISLSPQMMETMETDQAHNQGKGPTPAILVGIAAALVLLALFVSVSEIKSFATGRNSAYLAFLALACIGVQMLVGFPAENETEQDQTTMDKSTENAEPDATNQSIEEAISFQTVYKPALYLTLLALALPMTCSLLLTEPRRKEDAPMNTTLRPTEDAASAESEADEPKPPGQA
ncbi:MAG: hypothetical protein AAGA45_01985 [Verrucomicrobiota bacterium]